MHVTLTRHSCMGAFSTWMKSLGQNNHGFVSWWFWRELNLEQNGQDKFFNFLLKKGVEPLSVWLGKEIIWTWVVKKQEKWKRSRAYRREYRNKRSKSVNMSWKTKSVNLNFELTTVTCTVVRIQQKYRWIPYKRNRPKNLSSDAWAEFYGST